MHDELQGKLEAEYGQLPKSLKDVISAGEKLLSERFHLLKIADHYGWGAVTEFIEVELARNEVEEKKLKKIMKASELKRAKAREIVSVLPLTFVICSLTLAEVGHTFFYLR